MVSFSDYVEPGIAAGRAPALGAEAMVVTPHGAATVAGLEILRAGGSAVDAAIAVGAVLIVAQPEQCGLGADAFWLLRTTSGETEALNASGRAAAATDAERLRDEGLTEVPLRSGAAVTVPGLVSGWVEAHERHGRLDFDRLLAPAIRWAEEGVAVTPLAAWGMRHAVDLLAARPQTAALFLRDGGARRAGEAIVQPELAATLRELAADPRSFYRGRLAEALAEAVRGEGGWITPSDLEAHRPEWTDPLGTRFGDWTVEEMPPSSQGLAALIGLRLLDDLGLPRTGADARRLQAEVAAARILMAVRDAEIGDPTEMRRQPADLLGEGYLRPLRELLDGADPPTRARIDAVVGAIPGGDRATPHGDTVHFSIVDADGLAVSCIQSVFHSFGSGIIVPGTGILLHNRGASFSLDPTAVNALRPGRRPMHTLAPGMATERGRTAAVFGCMGGHGQAQIHLQILAALAAEGLDPVAAIERPRWVVPVDDAGSPAVEAEARGSLPERLGAAGYEVRPVAPFAQEMGHVQVIVVDHESGALMGAADPRSDGLALGY